jgi:hypothetical protein
VELSAMPGPDEVFRNDTDAHTRGSSRIIQILQDFDRVQEARIMIEVIERKLLPFQGEMHRKDTSFLGVVAESDVKRA